MADSHFVHASIIGGKGAVGQVTHHQEIGEKQRVAVVRESGLL